MASSRHFPVALLVCAVILGVINHAKGQVLFSQLSNTLLVTASLPVGGSATESPGLQTGQDTIVVSWKVNTTAAPVTANKVQIKLCFAKESQVDRVWRKTEDELKKDKSCLYELGVTDYTPAGATINVLLPTFVPRGKYFVRAYAISANNILVAYGQSSPDKVANVFRVIPISGRSKIMNAAVAILSVLSVTCLFGFFVLENIFLKTKKSV